VRVVNYTLSVLLLAVSHTIKTPYSSVELELVTMSEIVVSEIVVGDLGMVKSRPAQCLCHFISVATQTDVYCVLNLFHSLASDLYHDVTALCYKPYKLTGINIQAINSILLSLILDTIV